MAPKGPKLNLQRLSNSQLIGREKHTQALTDALDAVRSPTPQALGPQVVYIEAESGCGKTYLFEQWYKLSTNTNDILVGRGKFCQTQDALPYSGFVEAMSDLFYQMNDKETLKEELFSFGLEDAEIQLLVNFIPALRDILTEEERKSARFSNASIFSSVTTIPSSGDFQQSNAGSSDFLKQSVNKNTSGNHDGVDSETTFSADTSPYRNPIERLSYVLGEFLICLQSVLPLFLVFLDDLQFAEDNTRDLIISLAANSKLSGMLLVLASRPLEQPNQETTDGTNPSHSPFLMTLKGTLESSQRAWRFVALEEMDIQECTKIISTITEVREAECEGLAQVCHQKTRGNPYFLLSFLKTLHARELLVYNMTLYRWSWDLPTIEAQTDLADNVAATVLECIFRSVDEDVLSTLRIAARLGFSFDTDDVACILEGIKKGDHSKQQNRALLLSKSVADSDVAGSSGTTELVKSHLEKAGEGNLVNDQGAGKYKFTHDQILQCFLAMQNEKMSREEEDIQLGILILLLFRANPHSKLWALFSALHLLGPYCQNLPKECQVVLVRENVLAAGKAYKKSAFTDAFKYARTAVELHLSLEEKPWDGKNRNLCQKLHLMTATYALSCGNHDYCKKMAEDLISYGEDFAQKVDAYFVLSCSLRNQSKFEESMAVLMDVLSAMGEKVPNKPNLLQKAAGSHKANRALSKLSPQHILNLPKMKEPLEKKKMSFLAMLYLDAYHGVNKSRMKFVLHRMLVLTCEHGLCNHSPLAIAAHAYEMSRQLHVEDACQYGEVAMKLVDDLKARANLPTVIFLLVVYVNHLRTPMYKCLADLQRGFQIGMELGDSQAAFLCASTEMMFQFAIAHDLQDCSIKCDGYYRVAHEYGQDQLKKEVLVMWQLVCNLIGSSPEAKHTTSNPFDGVAMNQVSVMNEIQSPGDTMGNYLAVCKAFGNIYLGFWEDAAEFLLLMFDFVEEWTMKKTSYNVGFMAMYALTAWFKVLQGVKSKKILSKVPVATGLIRGLVENGGINVAPLLFFVEAQKVAMDQPFDAVKVAFDKAIVGLHRCGLRNVEALANQLFAEFAMENGDQEWASHYMSRAHELYRAWGAQAVAWRLEREYESLIRQNGSG
ncbi:Histidine kinase [Seminavis robusta]|uniref:Histidine kinase n=1 Tax=Seminavis robusta TaxID=568900 RepID=A0A9N8EGQ3_9STRA|nr:Histidine kinase [Seminavis robusta]|eukprot:Sro968_g225940.1 Histidine kinase (1114) ;mRNA; r:2969-6310